MYGILHLIMLSGPVELADHHAGTGGQAHKEADKHIDDGAYGSHGGEGLVADEVTHHPGIHHIVHLLEHVAGQQRQCKGDDMPGNAALGHIHVPAAFGQTEGTVSFLIC